MHFRNCSRFRDANPFSWLHWLVWWWCCCGGGGLHRSRFWPEPPNNNETTTLTALSHAPRAGGMERATWLAGNLFQVLPSMSKLSMLAASCSDVNCCGGAIRACRGFWMLPAGGVGCWWLADRVRSSTRLPGSSKRASRVGGGGPAGRQPRSPARQQRCMMLHPSPARARLLSCRWVISRADPLRSWRVLWAAWLSWVMPTTPLVMVHGRQSPSPVILALSPHALAPRARSRRLSSRTRQARVKFTITAYSVRKK